MKNKIKPMILFVSVLGSMISANTNAGESNPKAIELYPAVVGVENLDGELVFLSNEPLILEIETFRLDPSELSAQISLKPSSMHLLKKHSDGYQDKRLAVVHDGSIATSPIFERSVDSNDINIRFGNDAGFLAFSKGLADKGDTA